MDGLDVYVMVILILVLALVLTSLGILKTILMFSVWGIILALEVLLLGFELFFCDLLILLLWRLTKNLTSEDPFPWLKDLLKVSMDSIITKDLRHYFKYYKNGKRIEKEFMPLLRVLPVCVGIILLSLFEGLKTGNYEVFKRCVNILFSYLRVCKFFYLYEISISFWIDVDRLYSRSGWSGNTLFSNSWGRFLDICPPWMYLLRYLRKFHSLILYGLRIIFQDFLKNPLFILKWGNRFVFMRFKLYRKFLETFLFILQRVFFKIDWYRIAARILKIIRNRVWYPFARRTVWPFVWLYNYLLWRFSNVPLEFEEKLCVGRERGEISFCKCLFERDRKRKMGFPDVPWEGIKANPVSAKEQATMTVFDAKLLKEWEKIRVFQGSNSKPSEILYPRSPAKEELDLKSNLKDKIESLTDLYRICVKWLNKVNLPVNLNSKVSEEFKVNGPITKEMYDKGHPPFLGWRNDRYKELIKIEKAGLLIKIRNKIMSIWSNPDRENAIFNLLQKDYPDLTREEYDRLTNYNLENLFNYIKMKLGIENAFTHILLEFRSSPKIAHPKLEKKIKKPRRKLWKPSVWLDKPIFKTSDSPAIDFLETSEKLKRLLNPQHPIEFLDKDDYNTSLRVLLTLLRNIKSNTEQDRRCNSHGDGYSSPGSNNDNFPKNCTL